MANPFDQFDQKPSGNPFDRFDAPVSQKSQPAANPVQPKPIGKPEDLSFGEKIVSALPKGVQDWLTNPSLAGVGLGKGSAVHGAMVGAADPVAGSVQLAANATGNGSAVNQAIDRKNAEYELARKEQGRDGFDVARLAGNLASPANFTIARVAPVNAASTLGKVAQGARAGAIGSAVAPVENGENGFLAAKTGQVLVGGIAGGALQPVASKAGDFVGKKLSKLSADDLSKEADKLMLDGVQKLQREGVTLSAGDLSRLKQQAMDALKSGQKLDIAAAARKADFEALGMQPTLGQVTRDGAQFSKEKNLRGVAGVGEPLLQRFDSQAQRLQELVSGKSAGAADEFSAGQKLMQSLQGVDDSMKTGVNDAYAKARDHLGRAAPMDHVAFSKSANLALDNEMLGGVLPAQVRNILNDVTEGKIPLNVNTAVQIDQTLSRIQRGSSDAEKYAIGKVRDALNNSPIADNVGEDAKMMFDAARSAAKNRFKTHEAIPALKAAIDGDVSAQDFTRRFLINGKAEDVIELAKVMPQDAKEEARRQLGAAIERSAFGQNVSGDKAFSQESFAKFINQPGMKQKMAAFFDPDEIAEFERISRVGAYMNSLPANSTVNTSNTAAAVLNLLNRIPGVPMGVGVLNSAKNAATNHMAVNAAMKASPAKAAFDIPPEKLHLLARTLRGGQVASGLGVFSGAGVGND